MDTPNTTLRASNAQNSPLLALPGELRNRIYRYVLLEDDILLDLQCIHAMTNMVRASSQLRAEAKVIFYGENTFVITDAIRQQHHVENFLKWIGSENTRKVGCIKIQLHAPPNWTTVFRMLADSLDSDMSEAQAFAEVVKELGTKNRTTAQEILTGASSDNLNAIEAIARNLVDSGVPADNIEAQHLGDPDPEDRKKRVEHEACRPLLQKLTEIFLDLVQARWREKTEKERSVAGDGCQDEWEDISESEEEI